MCHDEGFRWHITCGHDLWLYDSGIGGQALQNTIVDKNCSSVLLLEDPFLSSTCILVRLLWRLSKHKKVEADGDLNVTISKKQKIFWV